MEIKPLIYDTIFKAIFTREKNILFKMIKDILEIKDENLKMEIAIPGYELVPLKDDQRTFKTDILIKLSDGTYVNLEINKRKEDDVLSRNILHIVRIYSETIKKGRSEKELTKVGIRQLTLIHFLLIVEKQ